ncbi:RNA-directed DNA polymerase [Vibrio rotiferianus]|uniref:RNA-directed DNA polymerase n=1 Tax=Vibrio rotiferianus TaxID=190895 RepID=UPI00390A014D
MNYKNFENNFITIDELYLSYRKAKQEAFYESTNINAIDFARYEENLEENINKLYGILVENSSNWFERKEFIGSYFYIPKSLDESKWSDSESSHFRTIDPIKDWNLRFKACRKKLDAEYRLIINPTINYHIVSALWILKVGHKFEEKLDKSLSYGNRLRRIKVPSPQTGEFNNVVNINCNGLFQPYFSAYQNWRKTGLKTIKNLAKKNIEVTAVTMDITSFYHNVSPRFMLRKKFLSTIGVQLSKDEKIFTSQLIDSIETWYSDTPDHNNRQEGALPVGLSASKIISNILLFELDNEIKNNLKPAYYGRYVDDIFLVIKTRNITSSHQVLSNIRDSIKFLSISLESHNKKSLRIDLSYAKDCELRFKEDKQKIFNISSSHGLDLINQISNKIREQSSEYKLLPEVPKTASLMAEKTLLTSVDASLEADALRKADYISIKRWNFSVLLRNIQIYTSNLSPEEWSNRRQEFYKLVSRYFITPRGMFDLHNFIPRIFRILIENRDFQLAIDFISKLEECLNTISTTTLINGLNKLKIEKFKEYISRVTFEALVKSSTINSLTNNDELLVVANKCLAFSSLEGTTIQNLDYLSNLIFYADLGSRPYKEEWFHKRKQHNTYVHQFSNTTKSILRLDGVNEFIKNASNDNAHINAFLFPTRPLTVYEIALSCPKVMYDKDLFKKYIFALRGASVATNDLIGYSKDHSRFEVNIPNKKEKSVNVAITSFEVTNEQFEGALNKNKDKSIHRFEKINRTINSILNSSSNIDYVIFPECSIPLTWSVNIAKKLAQHNISFICGIEYYQHISLNNTIRNDCLVSLTTKWPGYNTSFLILQPKQEPSHSEKLELRKHGYTLYAPEENEKLPVYKHGNYNFGILICSDLTNPYNRCYYQGKVDSLFVLSWNKDINTFSYLVDSAAHDIHSFIVLVNNRKYGDSRVRVPDSRSYKRDLVRVKGGEEDYFVLAKIDYLPLRKFHNNINDSGFKPLPIGFKCSEFRSYLVSEDYGK